MAWQSVGQLAAGNAVEPSSLTSALAGATAASAKSAASAGMIRLTTGIQHENAFTVAQWVSPCTQPYVPQPGYLRGMVREIHASETALAYPAMLALRAHLASEEEFVRRVDDVQRAEGYRLAGAFEDGIEHALAVAGFRVVHNLAWGGSALYVDDLSTLADARRRGHGRAVLDWTLAEARRLGCDQFHLDSAVGPARADAHRLYMNAGLQITAFHFQRGS